MLHTVDLNHEESDCSGDGDGKRAVAAQLVPRFDDTWTIGLEDEESDTRGALLLSGGVASWMNSLE